VVQDIHIEYVVHIQCNTRQMKSTKSHEQTISYGQLFNSIDVLVYNIRHRASGTNVECSPRVLVHVSQLNCFRALHKLGA